MELHFPRPWGENCGGLDAGKCRSLGGRGGHRLARQASQQLVDDIVVVVGGFPEGVLDRVEDVRHLLWQNTIVAHAHRQNPRLAALLLRRLVGDAQLHAEHLAVDRRLRDEWQHRVRAPDLPLDLRCPLEADVQVPVDEHARALLHEATFDRGQHPLVLGHLALVEKRDT